MGGAGEGEVFNVGGEVEVHRAVDRVRPLIEGFHHHVQGGIHGEGVISQAAIHGVVAGRPIDRVVTGEAVDGFVSGGAEEVVGVDGAVDHPWGWRRWWWRGYACAGEGNGRSGERSTDVEVGKEHGCGSTVAVAVVAEGACGGVVEDALQAIGGRHRASSREELGGGEGGACTEGGEDGPVELEQIAGGEICYRVQVVGGQGGVELEDVEASTTHKAVAAGAAIEGVVAGAPIEGVVAGEAAEGVIGGIAGDHVGDGIAGATGRCSGEDEVFQLGTQRGGDGAVDGIGAAGRSFHHHIKGGIHDVGVVAEPTGHCVIAGATIQGVVAVRASEAVGCRIAGDGVGQGIAAAVDRRSAGEHQVFNVGAKSMGH